MLRQFRAGDDSATPSPWSIVGRWTSTTPDGVDTLNIRLDGSFDRAKDGESGKWTLSGVQDHLVLTLGWDNFPQTTLTLVKDNQFRGATRKGEMVLDRKPPVTDFDNAAETPQPPKTGAAAAPDKSGGVGPLGLRQGWAHRQR
ncbi:MAG TPA: hypothetical protein VG733_10475 [Chthoniobacteraceae bacterium]|nr:hypothetical protein [Chthoniobacteraceae bacterium]